MANCSECKCELKMDSKPGIYILHSEWSKWPNVIKYSSACLFSTERYRLTLIFNICGLFNSSICELALFSVFFCTLKCHCLQVIPDNYENNLKLCSHL